MAEVWEQNSESNSPSGEGYHERLQMEPIYEAFICPLTKEIMQDPVTIENGQTFERVAIEKWFMQCRDNGRRPTCPLTQKELSSTDLNPSIALRNTIEEWNQRNDSAKIDNARVSLSSESPESDTLRALKCVENICQKSRSHKHIIRNAEVIPLITGMLKNSSRNVRCKALETLRLVSEEDDDNKEAVAVGDTIRTIVKFLSHDLPRERGEAVSLLYELSKSESLCEKIGGVNGSILILVGMASSNSENVLTVQKAERTLENLERCEKNVFQMAENGRLQPLLRHLIEGSPDTQLAMASHLGELVLSNDVKALVAQTAGPSLISVMRSGSMQAREASLKALYQISSNESSARLLIEAGILPPLVKDLFSFGSNQLPMRLKEFSAAILANIVASGADFESIPVDQDHQTLVSEAIIHNLLHLISNTGPAIESQLLQVLVGLTSSLTAVESIVTAIKSSGAMISLIQFIEAPQGDLRKVSIKLLRNISPYMGRELADALCGTAGQLGSLIKVISEDHGISEEQAAAVGLLAELPERDLGVTQHLLNEGAFDVIISKVCGVCEGKIRVGRFVNPYLEGLVRVLTRITYVLEDEPATVTIARANNLTALYTELLQRNGLDNVQMISAVALENLSQQSKRLARIPEVPKPGICCIIFPCLSKNPTETGLCRVHHGFCSASENFCLLDAKAVEKLVACLDHANEKVVEAALAALCTLLDDEVDIEQGVFVLCDTDGIRLILQILTENRTVILRQRAVWAVERILRTDEIAFEVSGQANVGTALVDAFQHADYQTRQIAEKALKLIDRLPNFSGIFQKIG